MLNSKKIRREAVFLLLIIFLVASAVVWVRILTVKATYRYVAQDGQLRQLQEDIQRAKVEWLGLTAPKHLDRLASQLELFPPGANQVVRYEPLILEQ